MNFRVPLLLAVSLAAAACSKSDTGMKPASVASAATPAAPAKARTGSILAMGSASLAHRFGGLPDRGALVRYPAQPVVRHDGAYTWHRADLSEAHARSAVGGVLTMTSPSGEPLRFRYSRHVEHANGDWTWVGTSMDDATREAIITFGDKAAFGSIGQPGKEPLRLTIANGTSWLVETDPRQIAGISNAATKPTSPDFFVAPEVANAVARRKAADGALPVAAGASTAAATAATGTTVDVVIGYTNGFVNGLGGDSQAQTRLNFLVDVTNEAYVNSQVNANVRLVKTVLVNYPDATSNDSALEELTGFRAPSTRTTPAPAFAELRSARDKYGADLVSLVRKFNDPENDGCGIAWLVGGARSGIDQSDEFFGYSVVSDGKDAGNDGKTYFCRDETFAHELGHNMGSAHDRDTSDGDDNVLQSDEYGVFDYSFGYKTTAAGGNFYTIMAYGDSGQTRYRVFSNPRITFCGGVACGIENQADNARSLNQTIPTVATFRATVVPVVDAPPPTTTGPMIVGGSRDLDGDGKPDVLWFNPSTRELYYWTMNGAALRFGGSSGFLPAGYTPAGVADFNGDGLSDVLLTSGSSVAAWIGNGRGQFQNVSIAAYPGGWTVAGIRDMDADGKDDVVWFNPTTSEIYYWLMNGGVVRTGRGGIYAPANATPRAIADFTGDGRADIVLASAGDIWLYMGNASGTFTSGYVAGYPVGWTFVGAADMNADSRADFVWHQPATGELYYWLQNGATIQAGRGGVYGPTGSTPIAMADFSADRRADVMFATSANIWTYVGNTSGTFASGYTYTRPVGWNVVQ